jgi:hypothetical protein
VILEKYTCDTAYQQWLCCRLCERKMDKLAAELDVEEASSDQRAEPGPMGSDEETSRDRFANSIDCISRITILARMQRVVMRGSQGSRMTGQR